ncbi:MAG: trypsin-like peptidase domain-containing protein, partial [Bacteroidetes bacterium]|nr:trypsin-like peptidase domain-containing protein [Bacteroidota bacterium]
MFARNIKQFTISLLILLSFQYCNSESRESGGSGNKLYTDAKNSYSVYSNGSSDDIANSRHNAITKAVEECSPAIVGINVTEVYQVEYREPYNMFFDDPFFQQFFGNQRRSRTREYSVQGLGSGFIISQDGYILTNHHVAGNASKIIVTTTDGKKFDAEIIGADKTSDVALLKIKGDNFPYLKLANSDDVIIGEWSIAFGNPFGLFDINTKPTITVGVVSNKNINFTQDDRVYRGMIQTDAAISSGNSGGPLVNSLGEVIGINTVIFSTAQSSRGAGSIGIGFAIPINRVKKVVDIIKDNKKINRNFNVGMEV